MKFSVFVGNSTLPSHSSFRWFRTKGAEFNGFTSAGRVPPNFQESSDETVDPIREKV